jgi:hypothetical protein
MEEQKKDETAKAEIVRSDVNLERWSLFSVKPYRGVRVLRRGPEEVRIGTPGSTACLGAAECRIFVELLSVWEGAVARGADPYASIGESLRSLTDGLYAGRDKAAGGRKHRRGNTWRAWLEKHLDNMLTVPIVWISAYREKNGTRLVKESFTLVDRVELFDRDSPLNTENKYYDLSRIRIHKRIVDSLISGNTKPIRKDVIDSLTGRIDPLLYRKMDPILSHHGTFEKAGPDLCHELGISGKRERQVIARVRAACRRLLNKELSADGRIAYCDVETAAGGGWKVVARRGPRLRPAKVVKMAIVAARPKALPAVPNNEHEEQCLWRIYRNLGERERGRVAEIQERILAERPYADLPLTREIALLDSIKRYRDDLAAESLAARARHRLPAMRENGCDGYMGDAERAAKRRAAAMRLAGLLRALAPLAPGG